MPVSGFPVSGNTVSGDEESHGRDVECNVCCGGGVQCETPPCVVCDYGVLFVSTPTASAVQFTAEGFTDGGTHATLFNGTWKLCHNGFCAWRHVDSQRNLTVEFGLTDYPFNWTLRLEDNATYGAGCYVKYKLQGPNFEPFKPFGSNIFIDPVWGGGGSCSPGGTPPAAIEVIPWPTTPFCGCCYPRWPPGETGNLPTTFFLTETFQNCFGAPVALTYDPVTFSWKAAGVAYTLGGGFCSGTVDLEFFCGGGSGGPPGDRFSLKASFDGLSSCTTTAYAVESCSPFLWDESLHGSTTCQTCAGFSILQFKVTE